MQVDPDALTDDDRREILFHLQRVYDDPMKVARHVYKAMGLTMSELSRDIVRELTSSSDDVCFQAQRGATKTTTVMSVAPFWLIQDPNVAILLTSGNAPLARRIAITIKRILSRLPELMALMPSSKGGGDEQTAIDRFELHASLRPLNKSATLQVRPIDRAQGERFNICICDDIETLADFTAASQNRLDDRLAELQSMKVPGERSRVVMLGTPQSRRSVYMRLKGFRTLVYPGRFPTPAQVPVYQGRLAPWITRLIERYPQLQTGGGALGDQGQPTSPEFITEAILQDRELKQGYTRFQMRHMLNVEPLSASRRALSCEDMILINASPKLPIDLVPDVAAPRAEVISLATTMRMLAPSRTSVEYREPDIIITAIDPALGGKVSADRTAVVTVAFMQGYMTIIGLQSIKGGYSPEIMERIAQAACKHAPSIIVVEKNAGHGMFANILRPTLQKVFTAAGVAHPQIEDFTASGQKEARDIDALEPILGRRAMAITREAIAEHDESLADFNTESAEDGSAAEHSLFQQIDNITRERGALRHDDMIDALAIAAIYRSDMLAIDQADVNAAAATARILERAQRFAREKDDHNNCFTTILRSSR